jgi:hypothetical protein
MAKPLDTIARIETIRGKIDATKARRREIEFAPLPRVESVSLIRETIAKSAAEWRADFSLSAVRAYPPAPLGALRLDDVPLAAVAPDALEKTLVAALDAAPRDYPDGLPARERPAALAAIDAEILALEIDEEQVICDAEQIGQVIDRRPDADPRAILAVV